MKKLKINSKQFNTELSTLTDKDLKAVYGGLIHGVYELFLGLGADSQ